MVRCVCRNCGDERSYSAAGEPLQWSTSKPKGKRGQFAELLKDEKGESAPDLSQISPAPVPESVPVEDQESISQVSEETSTRIEPQAGKEVTMGVKPKEKKRREYEAAKDNIIKTWHRHHKNVSAAARELKMPKSSLSGKLMQWRLMPLPRSVASGSARHDGNYRYKRHEELEAQKEKIIACWRKHGGNISQASKELKIYYSTLKGKLIQWELVPGWKSYKKRCPARTGGDPTRTEAQAQMNRLLTGLYDERARIDNLIQSVKTAMGLLKLQEVTAK